jgi:hypothetical protein
VAATLALLALCACETPAQVAARCERDVRTSGTTAISGEFTMGVASGRGGDARFVTDSDIAVAAGVNLGGGARDPRPAHDPRTAYEDCVRASTGQGPVRPFGAS